MARDLKLNVDGNSAGGQRALEEAALAVEVAAKAANHLGDEFKKASRDAADLDRKLVETTVAARALAAEFAKTNDSGIKKQLDAQKKAASELKSLRRDIIGDTEAAARSASKFAEDAAKDLEKLTAKAAKEAASLAKIVNPGEGFSLGGALPAAAGVAAGPALAAAGGATAALAGVGAAGIGVAGAVLGNPQAFAAAWAAATGSVKKDFFDATVAFTGPTLDAIKTIGPTISSWHLGDALRPAIAFVPQIVHGIEGFATGVEKGAAALVSKAGPAVAALDAGLVQLGQAGGDALSHIADGADGGAQALHDVIQATSAVIEGFGLVTEAAEKAYGFIQDHPIQAALFTSGLSIGASIWANALGNVDQAGAHFGQTMQGVTLTGNLAAEAAAKQADDFAALGKEIAKTATTADTLAGAMTDKLLGSLLASDQAALGFQESLTRADKALKDNKRNLDIHSEAGQADREAILGIVEANIRQYDTMIAAGATAHDAAAAYDANTAALDSNLRKAGLTQAAIDGLIGKYKAVPDKVNTDIVLHGLETAIRDLNETLRLINGIHDKNVIISVATIYSSQGHPNVGQGGTVPHAPGSAFAYGGIRHAMTGLIVGPSDPGTLIGEPQTGGELLLPLRGISQARAANLAQAGLAGYGLDVVPRGARVPNGLFGGRGGSDGAATPQLVYSGSGGGLDGLFVSWLAQQLRTGALHLVVAPSGQIRAA